jgi:hypothetical protein
MASVEATLTDHRSSPANWRGFQMRDFPAVSPWVERLGRAGYFAKGIVYFIIGFLALKLAIGVGGEITGAKGAIREIGAQPYGRVLLGLMAIGLMGYLLWRVIQAVQDTEGNGNGVKGLVKRAGYLISGLVYATLGLFAGSLALGLSSSGSDSTTQQAKESILQSSVGQIAIGIAGVVVFLVGINFIYKAYAAKFMEKYPLGQMSEFMRNAALHLGRTGLVTRGIAFAIIAWFLVRSAWAGTGDGEIEGVSDALAALVVQPYGKVLLGTAGFGLIAFGLHTMMLGWFRRFNVKG